MCGSKSTGNFRVFRSDGLKFDHLILIYWKSIWWNIRLDKKCNRSRGPFSFVPIYFLLGLLDLRYMGSIVLSRTALLGHELGIQFRKVLPQRAGKCLTRDFHLLDRAHSLLRNLWFTFVEDTHRYAVYVKKTSKKLSSRSDILYTNLTYLYKKMFHFKNCQLHLQTTRISLHVRQIHPWGIYGLWRVFTCAFGGLNDGKLDGANIWDWRPHHFSGPNWNFYALEGLKVNVLNFCPRICVFFRWFLWIGIPWDQTHHLSRQMDPQADFWFLTPAWVYTRIGPYFRIEVELIVGVLLDVKPLKMRI